MARHDSVLAALILTTHHDARRQMRDAYGRVGGVDVLTSAPEERNVSMRRSFSSISTSPEPSSSNGVTSILAKLV